MNIDTVQVWFHNNKGRHNICITASKLNKSYWEDWLEWNCELYIRIYIIQLMCEYGNQVHIHECILWERSITFLFTCIRILFLLVFFRYIIIIYYILTINQYLLQAEQSVCEYPNIIYHNHMSLFPYNGVKQLFLI